MPLPSLSNLPALDTLDLHGQRVLLRLDLNVAPSDAQALAVHVQAALPTVQQLLKSGARVVVAAHCEASNGELPSLEAAGALLAESLQCDLYLPEDVVGDAARKVVGDLRAGQLALLENLAREPGELGGDESFARRLSSLCDVYVNDAPSLLDSKLASLVHLPRLVPVRTVGLDMTQSLSALRLLEALQGRITCVFSSATLTAPSLTALQSWLGRVDTLVVVDAAATAFAAASAKGDVAALGWPPETLAHCRSLLATTQARDKKLLWPPNGLAVQATNAWLSQHVLPGPLLLVGPWPCTESTTATLSTLLAQRNWVAAAGIDAVQALQTCDPALLGPVALRCLNSGVVLRVLAGGPLPALSALSAGQ